MEIERETEQELEWSRAQGIVISMDLLPAAKQQLEFLAVVDRNRWLYEGPELERAIHRYNSCWLPLLDKHSASPLFDGPLVVPLDCEWVWHCHRLNPVRYKFDCEEFFGRILDCSSVVSSINEFCRKDTEATWNSLYPDEPYQFDLVCEVDGNKKPPEPRKSSTYDFLSASKRQISFFYQVSKPHMMNEVFLAEAVARYKGFLHLKRRNNERSISQFCVPTYDIDLIWHAHQLNPACYCDDVTKALGELLGHDDSAADRTKGLKLDTGYRATLKQWEDTFGSRYWKAGSMYRGPPPSPVSSVPLHPMASGSDMPDGLIPSFDLHRFEMVEVFADLVAVKNLPDEHKRTFAVTIRKKHPDKFFSRQLKLHLLSEQGDDKHTTYFRCEPNGELYFQLRLRNGVKTPTRRSYKTIASASFSLDEFFSPLTKLSVEKWVELVAHQRNSPNQPMYLRIALSFTVPIDTPYKWRISRPKWLNLTPFSFLGKLHLLRNWTHVTNQLGGKIVRLQMRDGTSKKKLVAGKTTSGETRILAEWTGTQWSLMDGQWCLLLKREQCEGSHVAELVGCRTLKLFEGPKLKFEVEHRRGKGLVTVVEFSSQDPYGNSIALLDLISGSIKVDEQWFVLPGILLAFILGNGSFDLH